MKINSILMSLGAAAALSLCACSGDEPANGGTNPDDVVAGDSYLSVSIMMPTSYGGRAADNSPDNYDKGTENESKITNIVFFFFDSNNNVVDIQRFDDTNFTKPTQPATNPYVSSFGSKEVRLKAGLSYKQVAVVLNTSSLNASQLIAEIKTLDDLTAREQDYAAQVKNDGTNQVMSNSVFYDTDLYTTAPTEDKKYILVPITENNIYKSTERKEDGSLPDGKDYVEIYVERVASKITVTTSDNILNGYYTSKDGDKTFTTITLYNNINLTTKTVKIRPEIKGVTLTVLPKMASLIKNISADKLGYANETASGFLWNDPANKRCYWAQTPAYGTKGMSYFSWNAVNGKGLSGISKYINPNTQDFEVGKENNSLNTKVMVVAQLFAYDDNDENYENPTPIDLVRYGSEYMESSNLLTHITNLANVAVHSINWDMLGRTYTPAEIEVLKVAVNNSFNLTNEKFLIKPEPRANDFDTYSAVIAPYKPFTSDTPTDELFDYTITVDKTLFNGITLPNESDNTALAQLLADDDALAALIAKAKANTITPVITDVIAQANEPNIFYWKDGKTYFYTTIRHQGFYGLVGGDNYLNGVVRNHIYNVSLEGIYGLGTPVIDPQKEIDPERPENDRPSYLQARINILPWRIVTNNATIH